MDSSGTVDLVCAGPHRARRRVAKAPARHQVAEADNHQSRTSAETGESERAYGRVSRLMVVFRLVSIRSIRVAAWVQKVRFRIRERPRLASGRDSSGAPGRTRTCNPLLRRNQVVPEPKSVRFVSGRRLLMIAGSCSPK